MCTKKRVILNTRKKTFRPLSQFSKIQTKMLFFQIGLNVISSQGDRNILQLHTAKTML